MVLGGGRRPPRDRVRRRRTSRCWTSRAGIEWATWFVGGRLNMAWNCVGRWAIRTPDAIAAVGGDRGRRGEAAHVCGAVAGDVSPGGRPALARGRAGRQGRGVSPDGRRCGRRAACLHPGRSGRRADLLGPGRPGCRGSTGRRGGEGRAHGGRHAPSREAVRAEGDDGRGGRGGRLRGVGRRARAARGEALDVCGTRRLVVGPGRGATRLTSSPRRSTASIPATWATRPAPPAGRRAPSTPRPDCWSSSPRRWRSRPTSAPTTGCSGSPTSAG